MRPTWLLCVLSLASCGTEDGVQRPPRTATGSIAGAVRLLGNDVPRPTRVGNTTDPEVCGREHDLENLVVSPETRGVRYAIAFVRDVPPESIPDVVGERVVMDNRDCRFAPHVAVATVGSTLEALNSDPVLHTTHLYGPADVNISLPVEGARSTRTLERPGTYVVKCDIHGWMQAFVRVDPHPFHAVTDERGEFRIEGVPVGRHTLEVWHETLGSRELPVEVEEGAEVSVLVEYPYPEN